MLLLGACDMASRVEEGNRDGRLHVALPSEPQSLDPHVASSTPDYLIIGAIMEPLVGLDPATLEPRPGVAERWSVDPDGLGATFHLRKSARWSNGDPVTAGDFVFAWRRALNPRLGNQLAEVLFPLQNAERIYDGTIEDATELGVQAIDDHTLRLTMEYAIPEETLIGNLSHESSVPLHAASLLGHGPADARYSGWARPGAMVTNGAYALQEWQLQRRVSVRRNPHYWKSDAVTLETVIFHPVENVTTQEKLFRSGQLHRTFGLPPSKVPYYREIADSPLVQTPILRSNYLAVNLQRATLDNPDVRRALALAIDREALAVPIYNGAATPIGHYIPPGVPDYLAPDNAVTFDPAQARRLLARAGFPAGAGFPRIELMVASSEAGRALATSIRQMWADHLSIEVDARVLEYQVYLNALVGGEFDLAFAAWTGGLSPSAFLERWRSEGPTNDSGFSHAGFDRLVMQEARSASDLGTLMEIYRDAERIMLDTLPVIPLFQGHATFLRQPSVEGMPANILNRLMIQDVSLRFMEPWRATSR